MMNSVNSDYDFNDAILALGVSYWGDVGANSIAVGITIHLGAA
jgi:hypothetical protein